MEVEIDQIQREINAVLKRGIVFSIVWLAGFGSLIAIMSGLKAKRLIAESKGAAFGIGRVRWCLIVGSIGLAIWIPVIVIAVINNLR